LLAETPILRDLLGSLRMRDASNSEDFIDFPGGVLVLAGAVRPRPLLHVSEWADAHRVLTSISSALAGRWKTDRTPYLREIMNDLSATSTVQRVVMRFAAQLGKTEVGLNWIGYVMSHAPGPMLVVVPTLEVRKRWK
jgi:phage terminase large subunit GpA-like protein